MNNVRRHTLDVIRYTSSFLRSSFIIHHYKLSILFTSVLILAALIISAYQCTRHRPSGYDDKKPFPSLKWPETHRALGRMYMAVNNWQNAAAEFEKALHTDPKNPDLLAELGISLMRLEKWDEARQLFIEEMQLKPGDPEPLLRLASIEEARGNTPDAIRLYNRALMLTRKGRFNADIKEILKRLKGKEADQ